MNNTYIVSRMKKSEIVLAMDWAAKLGWNPGLHDDMCFYQADPNGFFAGKLNNQIVAIASCVVYDDEFAFCGLYIVDENHQGQGYGLKLAKECLSYIGNRNSGLDGVTNMVDKYTRMGYKVAHHNARYEAKNFSAIENQISTVPIQKPATANDFKKMSNYMTPLSEVNFSDLLAYDRRHFPAMRASFLKCWIQHGYNIGYIKDGVLSGYGVIRACREGFKIGPLFADTPEIADSLFLQLASKANGQTFFLDIPENNIHACELVKRYQLNKVFETSRMYSKAVPDLPINEIYGITTYELG
jgi:hypothetical protein